MTRGALFLAALGLLLARPAAAADFPALLDSVVAAYGGSGAAARLEAHRVEARVHTPMSRGPGRVVRDFQAPDRLRVTIAYPERTEVRVLDGERGWRGDAGRLRRVEGLPNLAMVYQLLRSAVPWVFLHHRPLLEDRGQGLRGGVACRKVGLPWSMGLDLTYWVDAASRRVVSADGTLRASGEQIGFRTDFSDFRRVEGVLVPFVEESTAGGRPTGTTRVDTVRFAPPDLGPFDPTRLER